MRKKNKHSPKIHNTRNSQYKKLLQVTRRCGLQKQKERRRKGKIQ